MLQQGASVWALAIAVVLGLGACAGSDDDGGGPADVPAGPGLLGQMNGAASPPASTAGAQGAASAGQMSPTVGSAGTAAPPGQEPFAAPVSGSGAMAGMPTTAGADAMEERPPTQTPSTPGEGTCLQSGDGSYGESGPYSIGRQDITIGSQGMYTLFYPEPLDADCLHPIVAWGNGTAVEGANIYAFFNENAASWGMVVAASHNAQTGSGAFHTAAIDYLLEQNQDPGSMFYGKLSTRAGTSGHSQGGFGAVAGSAHDNVEALVTVGASGGSSDKVSTLVLTGTEDIVSGFEGIIGRAGGKQFIAVWEGGDHFTTETLAGYALRDPGTLQMQRLYAAWFRCFLADDSNACALFAGGTPNGCGICGDTGWNALLSADL